MKNLANVVLMEPEMDDQFVHQKLASGEMIPFRAESDRGNAILTIEIKQKKTEKVLYVWYLSGKGIVGNGQHILDTLVALGKLNECVAIEAFASPGWGKYLTRAGFNIEHVFVRKEL